MSESAPAYPYLVKQLAPLLDQVAYVSEHSPLYRRKFEASDGPKRPTSLVEFRQLAYTEKHELTQSQAAKPPMGDAMCVDRSKLVRISSTSGTSGNPLYYGVTASDMTSICESWAAIYEAAGLSSADLALFAMAVGGPYGAAYGTNGLEYARIPNVPAGAKQSYDRICQLIIDLRPTVLVSLTNYPIRLAAQLSDRGYDPRAAGITKLVVGGEPIKSYRSELESLWDAEVFDVMGSGEFGMIWAECNEHGGMHYVSTNTVFIEYLDTETTATVDELVKGSTYEIVYSSIGREAYPLLRYRSRDLVKVNDVHCSCGRQTPRVEVVGRSDDMIKVRGVNIYPSAVLNVLGEQRALGVSNNFRIVLPGGERKFSTPLNLLVERLSADALPTEEENRLKLEAHLRGVFNVRTEITLCRPGELSQVARDDLGRSQYFLSR